MNLATIQAATKGIPYTAPTNGAILYNTVVEHRFSRCLELGFAHGVGSAYIAGGLAALGTGGSLISVDVPAALSRKPDINSILKGLDLASFVSPIFCPLGYTWYLLEYIESNGACEAPFDFCFIDGAHTWDADGFAFYLVASLLTRGGLIIFDDLDWSFTSSPSLMNTDYVTAMPEAYRTMPQVRKVFELLVRRDPRFKCWERDGWGYAQKLT